MSFRTGTRVRWNWGEGTGTGQVVSKYTAPVTLQLDGAQVTRDATDGNPAYRIEQCDGDQVLKSESELSRAS